MDYRANRGSEENPVSPGNAERPGNPLFWRQRFGNRTCWPGSIGATSRPQLAYFPNATLNYLTMGRVIGCGRERIQSTF